MLGSVVGGTVTVGDGWSDGLRPSSPSPDRHEGDRDHGGGGQDGGDDDPHPALRARFVGDVSLKIDHGRFLLLGERNRHVVENEVRDAGENRVPGVRRWRCPPGDLSQIPLNTVFQAVHAMISFRIVCSARRRWDRTVAAG